MDERIYAILNSKIEEVRGVHSSEEISKITRSLDMLIKDQKEFAFGIAIGRIYNSFHYQTRRILGRDATEEEFAEFVTLLSKRAKEIRDALKI